MGIKLIPACHFPFIFGMVFALNMSNPTRTGLRQCFVKRQTWTWTHKTHKFIYWFHKSGGIKLKTLQEKCCPFAPVLEGAGWFNPPCSQATSRSPTLLGLIKPFWGREVSQIHVLDPWDNPQDKSRSGSTLTFYQVEGAYFLLSFDILTCPSNSCLWYSLQNYFN